MTLTPIRVLLVSDSPHMRFRLERLLATKDRLQTVGICSDLQDALRPDTIEPHVILFDLLLPPIPRPAAIQALRDRFLNSEILALVVPGDDTLIDEALQAGAIGCIPRKEVNRYYEEMLFNVIVRAYNGVRFRVPAPPPAWMHPYSSLGRPWPFDTD